MLIQVAPMIKSVQIRSKLMSPDLSYPGKYSDSRDEGIPRIYQNDCIVADPVRRGPDFVPELTYDVICQIRVSYILATVHSGFKITSYFCFHQLNSEC